MVCGCNKCMKMCGVCLLVLGVLFLLRDLGMWDFWNIQWWTALILLAGLGKLGSGKCPDCRAMCGGKKKK